LAFGVASGLGVILVFLFVLFNEIVITPFIRPGESIVQAPVVDQTGMPLDTSPRISIPKINVEIPLVYGLESTDPKKFELALDDGIVHYPSTALPGQAGNAAFFGHSSNNIFNPGKYKFAFVLLRELQANDIFYLTRDGVLYTYEVIDRRVVKPTEVSVLDSVPGQTATATLITCDPPGTSTNRLVVVGRQISSNGVQTSPPVATSPDVAAPDPDNLPGNGPSLFTRFWRSL
jgi:sortase A